MGGLHFMLRAFAQAAISPALALRLPEARRWPLGRQIQTPTRLPSFTSAHGYPLTRITHLPRDATWIPTALFK